MSRILRAKHLDPTAYASLNNPILSWPLSTSSPPLTLIGLSRAADRTAFYIPELSTALDAGARVHQATPNRVFITHGHSDHSYAVTDLVNRNVRPIFYVPEETAGLLEQYLLASQRLTWTEDPGCTPEEYAQLNNHLTKPVKVGDIIPLLSSDLKNGQTKQKDASVEVDVVACDHSAPCVGYIFHAISTPLKPEYQSLPGSELGRLRKSGVDLTQRVRRPLFGFMGDTTPSIFQSSPSWLTNLPVIITECSFLFPEHAANATITQHTYWGDLEPIIRQHPNTTWILIHFSRQYKRSEIHKFFDELEDPPANVVVWVEEGV